MWWHVTTRGILRQEDFCELRPAWVAQKIPGQLGLYSKFHLTKNKKEKEGGRKGERERGRKSSHEA